MFSYEEYKKIISIIQESGRGATFHEAGTRDDYIIMRHDVEFSVDRAYQLSQLEKSMDFTSTYFFQWTNNSYNILSKKNTDMIHRMHAQGHTIGLHFALNGLIDIEEIKQKIQLEIRVLNSMLDFDIDTFSIHRPTNEILQANIQIEGLINAYEDRFFTYAEAVTPQSELAVKYLSDAQHRWNYGIPDEDTLLHHRKVQILTHPYSWTQEGYDNLHNFRTLVAERNLELLTTIDSECKHFAAVYNQL
ncbi:MAG: hypothetical protein RRX92_04270 [Lachnospiraceae bacterium]